MKLIWTEPSIEDLRSIRGYIARDSETYAVDLVGEIVLSAERLLQFPRMGRMVPEPKRRTSGSLFAKATESFTVSRASESKSSPSSTAAGISPN